MEYENYKEHSTDIAIQDEITRLNAKLNVAFSKIEDTFCYTIAAFILGAISTMGCLTLACLILKK